MKLTESTRVWIERVTGGRVVGVTALRGATSSLLHAIDIDAADGRRTLVLRRFVDRDWVKREPDLAIREGRCLQHATRAGLPAPLLIAVDADGATCGAPATLVTRLDGEVVLAPVDQREWLAGLADTAARIHRVEAGGFPWKYRRYNDRESLVVPRWSAQPEAWQRAIDIVQGSQPMFRECFVHRDYHPTNVLWRDGRVSGVVDWVNGCRGPAGIDVAWCRHNLACLHGVAVADEFLSAYIARTRTDFEYDPCWDLMSVVELLPGPPSMYEPWRTFGVANITNAVMRERVDDYLMSVLARF